MRRISALVLALVIILGIMLPTSSSAVAGGTVCIVQKNVSSCLTFAPVIPGVVGITLNVSILVQNSAALNGFDITLLASSTVLRPLNAGLSGTILPGTVGVTTKCIGGVPQIGSCSSTDNANTLHFAAIGGLGLLTSNPVSGLLFSATYAVVGATPSTPLGYQSCTGQRSVLGRCITITDGTSVPVSESANAATFSDLASADKFSDAQYYVGVNSMLSTLYNTAPCGSGLSSIHEAPSVPYNWWSDDAAKTLGAFAPSGTTYNSQTGSIINFLNYLNLGGYYPSRCVQISPFINSSTLSNPVVGNNLYIISGNPTLSQSNPNHIFRVSERENPTIAQAYMISTIASINNVLVNMDTGYANPVLNPGADAPIPLDQWIVNATVFSSNIYFHSPPRSFQLGSKANMTQIVQPLYQVSTTLIQSLTWWDTSDTGSQGYNARVYYTDGSSSSFAQTAAFSSSPGTWQQRTVLGSSLSVGKTLRSIGFTTGTIGGGVYVDDVSLNELVGIPSFSVGMNGGNEIETESLFFNGVTVSLSYILQPAKPYVLLTSSITNQGTVTIVNPTIYNAFDGMDTIGSGYAYVYLPGIGFVRPNQGPNQVTQQFSLNGMNDNWLAVDVHGNPDWIGTNAIFVNLDPTMLPTSTGPWKLNVVQNTIFQNSTSLGPTNYMHWFQMSMNNGGNITVGTTSSYDLKYVFAVAHDWTNMGVYANYFSGTNLDAWNGVYPSMNFYEGEIAYEAALFAQSSGGMSSISFPIATSVWNYYYRMIQAESNGTYTGSLARFVDAGIILYQITLNTTYLTGMKVGTYQLMKDQYTSCCFLNMTRYNFHQANSIATINTVTTFGRIFNQTTQWGPGTVLSGSTVNVNFFQSPALARTQNVSGTFSTTFWMNSNVASATGYYYTQLFRISPTGVTTLMAQSSNQTITLPSGSGSAPFKAFTSTMSVNVNVPSGYALEVNLQARAGPNTVYVCYDSSANCPSYLLDPDNIPAKGKGGFQILPPKFASPTAVPQSQPIFLDLTALAGQALYAANVVSSNASYVTAYNLAIGAIHWGTTPAGSGQVAGDHANILGGAKTVAPRIYIWANATYIDVDYSTYKAGVTVLFALPLNQTLANIAMSRVWDRVYMPNPPSPATFIQVDTGESVPVSSGEMNSETQPWGLTAWLYYTNFYRSILINGNSPQFVQFSNLVDVLTTVTADAVSTTLIVNGTGTHVTYVFTRNLSITSVTFGGLPIAYSYVTQGGGPMPGVVYVYFSQQWTPPGTFVITGVPNTGLVFAVTVGWPLYEAQGSWALNDITVTLSSLSGSTGNVTLGCPVLPIGVSCSFSPQFGVPSPTFDSVLNVSSAPTTVAGVYNMVVQGTSGTFSASVSFPLVVVPVGSTQLFIDDFVQQSPLPSSSWTQDWYGQSVFPPGNVRVNSGFLNIYSSFIPNEAHVNSPAFLDTTSTANNTLVVRKLTVGMIPFTGPSSGSANIVDVGWGPLCTPATCFTGAAGVVLLQEGGAGQGSGAGNGHIEINGGGVITASICGATLNLCRSVTFNNTGFNTHVYTVVTIKFQVLNVGPRQQNWMFFRVYQPNPNGGSNLYDRSYTFTFVNTDYRDINPGAAVEYMAVSYGAGFSNSPSASIDIVDWQDFGSPVLLTPPPPIPFPRTITGNGLIGLMLLVANSIGFGNPQMGVLFEFLLIMGATAFPIMLFTRSVLSTATVVLVVSAMFVYAGFLPTLVIFIEMIAVAGLAFMTFQKIISGSGGDAGEAGGSYGGGGE